MKPTYSKRAAKAISRIRSPLKQNIKDAIEKLPSGDVKKLQGYKNAYRLCVGDYRILFDMNEKIKKPDILPREAAYKH